MSSIHTVKQEDYNNVKVTFSGSQETGIQLNN